MKKSFRVPLRVVFYKENGYCVAHCLEFDLIGHGHDKQEAISRLNTAIAIQVEATIQEGNIANLITCVDKELLRMFCEGDEIAEGELHLRVEAIRRDGIEVEDHTQYREYQDGHDRSQGLAVV